MNKQEFLSILTKTLNGCKVPDAEDIIAEYEQHFEFKLADGYSEEEIAARLGDPEALAKQFASDNLAVRPRKSNKAIAAAGLAFADIFIFLLFILLYGWVVVMGAVSVASASIGVCLLFGVNIYSLIPGMPYVSALLFAVAMFALALLFAIGTVYCLLYTRQLFRAYSRWHKNTMAAASGGPVYPSLPAYPQMSAKVSRVMRSVALIALTALAVSFILCYIVSAVSAGSFEFWHAWRWFV